MRNYLFIFCLFLGIVTAQNNFSLEDVNPASDTYGQYIGPSYFSNNICVIGFSTNTEAPVGPGSVSLMIYI